MALIPLLQLNHDALVDWLASRSEPAYRARQIHRWIFQRGGTSFDEMTDLPRDLRQALASEFTVFGSLMETVREATGGTWKLLVRLADGLSVECVLIVERERRTVCISTQVGCGMGCVFCASGLAGVVRNLSPHEIVEQFLHVRNLMSQVLPSTAMPAKSDPQLPHLTHAVIMGMGEPLANLDHLLVALEQVCHPQGLNLGQRRVTISTVGLPQKIRDLAAQRKGYHLAVSLHAPDDDLRNRLVPPNRQIGIAGVLDAADEFFRTTGRQVTFEYVLLRNVNDQLSHAQQLARLLASRDVHINLIPYNAVPETPFEAPHSEGVHQFVEVLRSSGLSVKVRKTKGSKIDAACGQLRLNVDRPASQSIVAQSDVVHDDTSTSVVLSSLPGAV